MTKFSKYFTFVCGVLLTLLPTMGFAADTFKVPDTDLSKSIFIDHLFGPLIGDGTSEFSAVISIFNGAMLILAGILVAYTLIAGTMSTAHDGEVLGKKWSSMWVPIRTSVGAAMIFPLSSGFCAAQYVVMWIAMQGIGFADKLVEVFVDQNMNMEKSFVPPSNYTQRRQVLEKWLESATCSASMGALEQAAQATTASGFYTGSQLMQLSGQGSSTTQGVGYTYGLGMCGIINMTNETDLSWGSGNLTDNANSFDIEQFSDNMFKVNKAQMETNKTRIEDLAKSIAEGSDDNDKLKELVARNLDSWAKEWDKAMRDKATSEAAKATNDDFLKKVKEDGWLTFGAWYMDIAKVQDAIAKVTGNVPVVISDVYERTLDQEKSGFFVNLFKHNTFSSDVRASIKRAHKMSSFTFEGSGTGTAIDYASASSNNISATIVKWFITPDYKSMFDSNQDFNQNPVLMMQNLGRNMVGWGTAAYATGVALIIAFDREVGSFTIARLGVVGPLLTGIAGTILVTGAFISVYPPMLPFILWIGAVLGWVIFLVEAIIAAPLWVVAQISPDGDGVVGKGGQGYMLVLSLFLKPGLMVLGFISAVLVMKPMGYFINSTFLGAFLSGASPSWYGIVTAIMGCILYAVTMVGVINKIFALIHVIPDKILRWIGGGGNELGEAAQGVEGTAMGKMVAGAGAAATIGQATVSGAQAYASKAANAAQHEKGLKESKKQGDANNLSAGQSGIEASNERFNDAQRDMQNNNDFSSDGDTRFNNSMNDAQAASDANSLSAFKAAKSSASLAVSTAATKGKNATEAEKIEAQQAQSFLDSAHGVNANDPSATSNFMKDNASSQKGTAWGSIMAEANRKQNNFTSNMDALQNIRNNAKAAHQKNESPDPGPSKDPNQLDLFESDPNQRDLFESDPNQDV